MGTELGLPAAPDSGSFLASVPAAAVPAVKPASVTLTSAKTAMPTTA